MKKISSKTRVLLAVLIALVVIGAFTTASLAADKTASYGNKYGQIVPTDSKLEAKKTNFSFYGDKAILYFMRISEGKSNSNYAVEIYSDKEYKDLIRSMAGEFGEKGNSPLAISWNFKSTPSGTYYGKCYTYVSRDDGNVVDTDSVETFKIKIDRLSKKVVPLTSVKNTQDGVKITWTPLSTATRYRVYRKISGETKWTAIKTLSKGACTYTDETAKSGKTYVYTVRGFDGDYKSLYNTTGLKIKYLATPKLVNISGTGPAGNAKIKWGAVSGASGYIIYRKGGSLSSSSWEKIATVTNGKTVTYVDKTATKSDWYYTYTVRAYSGSYNSLYDTDGLDFNYIKAPSLKSATVSKEGIKLTWTKPDEDVVKYYVYRKTSKGWNKIGTTTKRTFVDTKVGTGKKYIYTIKAVCETNDGAYNNTGISAYYIATPELAKVTFTSGDKAKVTWKKVEGVDGYKVYRKINSASKWTEIATVKGASKTSYLDAVTKKSGSTYKYTVRAFDGKYKSYYDTKGIKAVFLAAPEIKLSNAAKADGEARVKITWNKVAKAESYNVYRKNAKDTEWTLIKKGVTKTSYYDSTVKNSTTYNYSVRAVNGTTLSRFGSAKIIALNMPVMKNAAITSKGVSISWSEVKGADSYYVYRRSPDGEWKAIGSYATNSYIDTSKEAKTNPYYYTVVAEESGYKSNRDSVGVKNYVEAVKFTANYVAEKGTSKAHITLKWSLDKDTEIVEIFKNDGEKTVSLGEFKADDAKYYIDEDIKVGTTYRYTIKPRAEKKLSVKTKVTEKYPHAPVEAVDFDVTPHYSEDEYYITIKFNTVKHADSYEVYKRLSPEDPWVKVKKIDAADIKGETKTYKDKDVDTELTYYYTVKAVASDRDSKFDEDGKKTIICVPVSPAAGIVAKESKKDDKTVAVITWDKVDNGETYKVLRKTAKSEWVVIGTVSADDGLKFVDDTIKKGVNYTYTVEVSAPGRGEAINETGAEFCWE